jgi:hypothetical protein
MDAMPILPPAPINDAMAALLARSRQVMTKLEDTAPTPKGRGQVSESYNNNYADPIYSESDEREPVYEQFQTQQQPRYNQEYQQYEQAAQVLGPIDYDAEIVRNSKLPQNIKDLMIAHPIKQASMAPQFTAEQISRITGKPIQENRPQQQQPQQRINENMPRLSNNPDMITLSKSDLKEMINEGIATFFKQVYDKTLTEETIKKTINVLIKEGKINVKK